LARTLPSGTPGAVDVFDMRKERALRLATREQIAYFGQVP
jgi:hypothetical protein